MLSVKEILEKSTQFLAEKGIAQARRQAEEVLADALFMKRIHLYLEFDRPLNESEIARCREALLRRSRGEPPQYIRGKVEFLDSEMTVNSSVLIPRQETEILAARIVEDLNQSSQKGKVLWDICCGSGCMGIAIKKKVPDLDVYLSDISKEALDVAQHNAAWNQVSLHFKHGDLLAPFEGEKADYVVCNPPYIPEAAYLSLEREVRDFEPKIALLAEENGLSFYRRLADSLPAHLNPGAKVWFEIGFNQGEEVLKLFQGASWTHARFEKDWSGNHRFFFLENE